MCVKREKRYEVKFLEIRVDKDYLHFLVQSEPTYSVTKIVRMTKSITARGVLKRVPCQKSSYGEENSGVMDILQVH